MVGAYNTMRERLTMIIIEFFQITFTLESKIIYEVPLDANK